jgi:toxin HigB-1
MIQSFGDRATESFANGEDVRAFRGFREQAGRRLQVLNAAQSLQDLSALRSNRLEVLRGNFAGHFSIRINDQWRIVFRWERGAPGPEDVKIMDYH